MISKIKQNKKIVAIVPAFNEETTIGPLVSDLLSFVNSVIVVNDASTDKTASIAEKAGALLIHHTANCGYDASLNDGMKKAYKDGADIFITFDADREHDVKDIPIVVAPIIENKADIVTGDRQTKKHIGEKIFAFYTNFRYGIPDPLCGFKAYTKETYKRIGYFDTLTSIGTQLMIEGLHSGLRLAVVPIHSKTRTDTSRFYYRKLRGHYRILRSLSRIILRTHFKKSHRENVFRLNG